MRTALLLATLLLTGCGSDEHNDYRVLGPVGPTHEQPRIELGEFEGYVKLFLEDAQRTGVEINISSLIMFQGEISQENETYTLGQCFRAVGAVPRIQIDSKSWPNMDMMSKTLLIYHELGHCILNRNHSDDPKSVMYPYLLNPYDFIQDHETILNELFDASKFNSWNI